MTEVQVAVQDDELEKIRAAKAAYYKENADFVLQFPENMRPMLADFGLGQAATEQAYEHYKHEHGRALTEGQHPHFAVISSSHWLGHPSNIIGLPDDAVGDVLALRTAGGTMLNAENEMNFEASLYLPLATQLKGIETVFHAKTDSDELLSFVYKYHSSGGNWEALPEVIRDDQYIRDFARQRSSIYEMVDEIGVEHYENKYLLKNIDDPKMKQRLMAGLSEEDRFVRAMSIQMLKLERKRFVNDKFHAANTVSVLQSVSGKRELVWSDTKDSLVLIPEPGETDPSLIQTFFDALPENLTKAEHGHPAVSTLLMRGAGEYRKILESVTDVKDALDFFIIACSDSRATTYSVAGPLAKSVRHPQRNPGAFLSLKEKLTSATGRFIALAKLHKKPLIIADHTNCGAMEAIDACLGKKGDVPGAFNELSENRRKMYETVQQNGVEHYRKTYGIPVENIADCMPIEQAIRDYAVVKRDAPNLDTYVVIQNMREPRNYLLNPTTMKFVAIPTANWGGARHPAPGRKPQNHFTCGCGSGH